MSSNCDSDGCPIDHDGNKLEEGVFNSGAPFAVRSDVLQELLSGSGKDVAASHLDAEPLDGSWVKPSALKGGIPIVERVEIEDITDGYSSEETVPPKKVVGQDVFSSQMSDTVHAILRTFKQERDALHSSRRKLGEVLSFLKKHGFSEEQVLAEAKSDGFGSTIPVRDEFGLPVKSQEMMGKPSGVDRGFSAETLEHMSVEGKVDDIMPLKKSANPYVDKMKGQVSAEGSPLNLKDDTPAQDLSAKPQADGEGLTQTWARIVHKDAPSVSFKYFPLKEGVTVVDPPDEVLIKGNEKFKNFVVGTFSKGTHSYKTVSEFVFKFWKHRGLISVHQKDSSTFLFCFADSVGVYEVLSRGTWYVDRRPMIVSPWGHKPGSTVMQYMPLWVKLSNLPDAYWTEDGLARVASVIGEPLGADGPTSKLEVLPFAKMQVRYKLGDPLPNDISVSVLDPISNERSVVKVLVSYPVRPLFCTGCKSLGHSISACPKVTRVWKVKEQNTPMVREEVTEPTVNDKGNNSAAPTSMDSSVAQSVLPESPARDQLDNSEVGWTEVKRKKQCSNSDFESPSPPVTFKNLKKVDEIEGKKGNISLAGGSHPRLTKSQKRKLKASRGSSPPSLS